ncbi:MAG: ethanolamine utilization protein EutN [Marinilabiliales bacterium]|mgnify:CR=1 FL=1|nr:MAG: ethanolamine utilization protein EutN [Marinilabiliales bacterium]
MKLGKIIGRVVSTKKVESFEGLRLLLLQPIDEKVNNTEDPVVAIDTVNAGPGDIVYYETSWEASQAIKRDFNPCDTAIVGIVDNINV